MQTDAGLNTQACPKYEVLLEDYLHGELEGADARNVAAHLAGCAGCRLALADAAAGTRLLGAASPVPGPGTAFSRTAMARIYAAEQERTAERAVFWQPFVSFGWRLAAAAALALLVLVTYGASSGRRLQPNVLALRPTAVNDLFSPDPARSPATSDEVLMMLAENDHGNQ